MSDTADKIKALHRFHSSGRAPAAEVTWIPRAVAAMAPSEALETYPVVVEAAPEDGDGRPRVTSYAQRVRQALSRASGDTSMVADHLEHLLLAAWRVVSDDPGELLVGEVHEAASRAFAEQLDLSPVGETALAKQLDALAGELEASGRLVGFSPQILGVALNAALDGRRRRAESRLRELDRLARSVAQLLAADDAHGPAASSPPTLEGALGGRTERFDVAALASLLPKRHGTVRMDPGHRQRLEEALDVIRRHLQSYAERPSCLWLNGPETAHIEPPERATASLHDEPLLAAEALARNELASLESLFSAARVARVALDEGDPSAVEGRSWRDLDADELALAPAIVAVVSKAQVDDVSMSPLSRLLRSGSPVFVVAVDFTAGLQVAEPGTLSFDLGLFGVAHREAFVGRTSAVVPEHLVETMARLLGSDRPGLVCVTLPPNGVGRVSSPERWLRLAAAHRARAVPVFHYDPARGDSWASRFELEGNPELELPWGRVDAAAGDEAVPLTWADAAGADPAFQSHFWVVSDELLDLEGVPVAAYAEGPEGHAEAVPFVDGVDEAGRPIRAAISRHVALSCWEHARAWRMLQELAGVHNEHVERALAAAEERHARERAELIAELERKHAEELARVEGSATEKAMSTLASALLSDGLFDPNRLRAGHGASPAAVEVSATLLAESEAPTSAASSSASTNGAAKAQPAAAEADDDEGGFAEEAYVETYLCTTCNECTNNHPKAFAYDANKQAVLTSPESITYAQLVDAAEKCPARCIHPGAPRPGDASATPDVVGRAQPFL